MIDDPLVESHARQCYGHTKRFHQRKVIDDVVPMRNFILSYLTKNDRNVLSNYLQNIWIQHIIA